MIIYEHSGVGERLLFADRGELQQHRSSVLDEPLVLPTSTVVGSKGAVLGRDPLLITKVNYPYREETRFRPNFSVRRPDTKDLFLLRCFPTAPNNPSRDGGK
jgi:hypothetical protein